MRINHLRATLMVGVCGTVLASCGGGGARPGAVASTPVPVPTTATPAPTPTPAPLPTPAPPSSQQLDTGEYRRSNAVVTAQAASAYAIGATGKGVKIGIVDSGIDPNSPEFAGRIDPVSQNVRSGAAVSASGYHGSSVAAIAAAARNGSGMQGLAFDSTIVALNSADPNGCGQDGNCTHDNKDIARGIDLARTAGAKVINISLGGSAPGDAMLGAVERAAQAGIVVVFSAGNDGAADAGELGLKSAQKGGHGLVILAGALNEAGTIADFSNRAGAGAAYFLTTLGERVQSFDQNGDLGLYSGTSYAAPAISGAVALIASAFPNMTGAQIIDLLFRTADDLGTPGVDAVYGHGALNLQRAFQPQGQTSLAGSTAPVSLVQGGQASEAMGDAITGQSFGAVVLDGYSRAFAVDFAARLSRAAQDRPLAQALAGNFSTAASTKGPVSVSLTVTHDVRGDSRLGFEPMELSSENARRARALAGFAMGRISPRTAVAFGFSSSGRELQKRLGGHGGDAFVVARDPIGRNGFAADPGNSVAVRQRLVGFGLTASGENGRVWNSSDPRDRDRAGYSMASVSADRWVGPALLSIGASRLQEEETVLGGRLGAAFTSAGASSWFVDGGADLDLGSGWGAAASYRRGWTSIPGSGGLVSDGRLATEAWSLDLGRRGAFVPGDRVGFRMMQPLRVASGGLALEVPVTYDYADGEIGYERRQFNLAPTGRELDFEAAYSVGLWSGSLGFNAYLRRQPRHVADAGDDIGTALRFSLAF